MTLVIDKMDGHAVLATKALLESWSASFIKVSGRMRSDAFKSIPAFSFIVTILA